MRKAIFTAIFDGYDEIPPAPSFTGWDFVLFTDVMPKDKRGWNIKIVSTGGNPMMKNREIKIMSHKFLPDHDLVCYVDGNVRFKKEPPSIPFWFKHPYRWKVKQEVEAVMDAKKTNLTSIHRLLSFFKEYKFRDDAGLFMNRFFCRKHEPYINAIHEKWYELTKAFETRDQLTFPFICAVNRYKPEGLMNANNSASVFRVIGHKKSILVEEPTKERNVIHITAGRSDKNIGKAINHVAERMDEDDWICLRDIDTFPAHHRPFFKQCEDIANSGRFDLVSCITNRLGLTYQLHEGKISDQSDILKHIEIGKDRFEKYGSKVKRINKPVAGVMMMFSREIWKKSGGFREGGIVFEQGRYFDYWFSMDVMKAGGKIGIAEGIYLFHLYRFESDNPTLKTGHLF